MGRGWASGPRADGRYESGGTEVGSMCAYVPATYDMAFRSAHRHRTVTAMAPAHTTGSTGASTSTGCGALRELEYLLGRVMTSNSRGIERIGHKDLGNTPYSCQ